MKAGVWTALLEAQCSGHQRELQPHCSCLGSSIHLVLVPAWNLLIPLPSHSCKCYQIPFATESGQ